MKKFIATVSFSAPIERTIQAIAKAGFDGIELLFQDIENYDGSPAELGNLCTDLGLQVIALQPLRDFEGAPEFTKKIEEAKQAFEIMNDVGTDLTVLCSNVSPDVIFEPNLWIDQLQTLSELAKSMGVRIAFEALSWGTFINKFEAAAAIVQRVDHPSFGLALDSFHTCAVSSDWSRLTTIEPKKIFLTQLADAPQRGGDLLNWSRNHRCFPGDGDFEVSQFADSIATIGYDGPYSFEVFSRELKEQPEGIVASNGMLAFLKLEADLKVLLTKRDFERADQAGWRRGL
jgi:4-hydroxyphenylpyruvate dioxygenase